MESPKSPWNLSDWGTRSKPIGLLEASREFIPCSLFDPAASFLDAILDMAVMSNVSEDAHLYPAGFGSRCHEAHRMLAGLARLAISSSHQVYDRLRAAYNSCRPHGSVPVPPLEEWHGMSSICEDPCCRCEGVSIPVDTALHLLNDLDVEGSGMMCIA